MKRLIAILFFIAFASVARADGPLLLHGVLTPNNCLVAISANTVEDGGFVCAGGAGGPFLPLSGGTMMGSLTFADGSVWSSTGIAGIVTANGFQAINNSAGSVYVNNAGNLGSIARGYFQFPSDGVFTALNNAGTNFNRLQLGGTTSSFPAIKRNGAALNFRLADDSADAAITALSYTANGSAGVSCAAGTVSLTTFTVTNGIVTHC